MSKKSESREPVSSLQGQEFLRATLDTGLGLNERDIGEVIRVIYDKAPKKELEALAEMGDSDSPVTIAKVASLAVTYCPKAVPVKGIVMADIYKKITQKIKNAGDVGKIMQSVYDADKLGLTNTKFELLFDPEKQVTKKDYSQKLEKFLAPYLSKKGYREK